MEILSVISSEPIIGSFIIIKIRQNEKQQQPINTRHSFINPCKPQSSNLDFYPIVIFLAVNQKTHTYTFNTTTNNKIIVTIIIVIIENEQNN